MTTPISDDPIDIIEQEAAAVAHCFGVQAAGDLAATLIDRITQRLAGQYLYFARERASARRARCDEIRAAFTGCNSAELARRFGVSVRYVRKIVNG
jgi:Mor family transcriptional regulator